MADLILPTHTYLEAWADDVPEPGVGVPVASISQPVVTPVFDTRASGDIILALAHHIGGELPAKLPWNQTEDYLKESWKRIYADQSEHDASFSFDDFWWAALKAGIWAEKNAAPAPQITSPADALKQNSSLQSLSCVAHRL